MPDYKYDLAISCLSADQATGADLRELLAGRVKSIFFYPNNQAELVAKNGLVAFRRVFSHQSRIVVVLYREGWGKTPWTGVEEEGIGEVVLYRRDCVVVYSMDESVPLWFGKTHLHGSEKLGGLEALAATIEMMVAEAGGDTSEEDVVTTALRRAEQLAAAERREKRRFSTEAVRDALIEVAAVEARLQAKVDEIRAKDTNLVWSVKDGDLLKVYTREATVMFVWKGWAGNNIQGAELVLLLSVGPPDIWQERASRRSVANYSLHLSEDETRWEWVSSDRQRFSSAEVADRAFRRLIEEDTTRRKAKLKGPGPGSMFRA